jgi:hypothetical protein
LDRFRQSVSEALSQDAWVTDGNYSRVRDIVWRRANNLVWLDYSLALVMGRVIRRTLQRSLTQQELWNQNRERLSEAFFSKDSIIWWSLSTFHRRRREYPGLFEQPEHVHLNIVHLRSPRDTRRWLARLPGAGQGDISLSAPGLAQGDSHGAR